MSLTDEQRQKLGSLIAKKRDLRSELFKTENEIDAEILQLIGAPFTKEETKAQYDLKKIETTRTEGPSGFYEKANEQDGKDYRLLVEDLKAHDSKLTRNGFFVWLFSDGKSVGMKPSKK